MCGLIGRIARSSLDTPLQERDIQRMAHRGPDDKGLYQDEHTSLGHARLSIIDLSSAGHQPMETKDGRYVIVYNGEVYNYLEIKEKLKTEGVVFDTHSDTEVVLKSYIQWGARALGMFRGMFAFALWDRQTKKLFMARDRCGEKPFLFFKDENQFVFASEFKALVPLLPEMPRLDPSAVDMYMHYQYTPEPFTLLAGVHKLPAAHYAVLDIESWSYEETEYWDLRTIEADDSLTKQDIREELNNAVKLTLRSDVEVGVALSAGIDSAGITAIAAKQYDHPMQAFCVGYPGRPPYDEREEAKGIAEFLGCRFNEVELATDQFVEFFPTLVSILDEPIADIAAFGHYAVPRSCSDAGIKVLLTGIGGDEIFWGYDRIRSAVTLNEQRAFFQSLATIVGPFTDIKALYTLLFKLSRTTKVPDAFRAFCRKLLACIDQDVPPGQLIYMAVTGAPEFTKHMQVGENWYGPAMSGIDKSNAYIPSHLERPLMKEDIPITIMDMHIKTWLTSNSLSLGDRVSMASGVETRLPLLDVRLIEKVVARRKARPDHEDGQKALLREILKGDLPEQTIARRKSGFIAPAGVWAYGVAEAYAHHLENGHLVEQGIMLPEMAGEFRKGRNAPINAQGLYRIVLLEMWYRALSDQYRAAHAVHS